VQILKTMFDPLAATILKDSAGQLFL